MADSDDKGWDGPEELKLVFLLARRPKNSKPGFELVKAALDLVKKCDFSALTPMQHAELYEAIQDILEHFIPDSVRSHYPVPPPPQVPAEATPSEIAFITHQ